MPTSEVMVQGSGKDFILSLATLNGSTSWPSDATVTLWLQQLTPYRKPPQSFAATVTVNDSTGLTANYAATPAGSGYPGDLGAAGTWRLWWVVKSTSTRLVDVCEPIPFEVEEGPLPVT